MSTQNNNTTPSWFKHSSLPYASLLEENKENAFYFEQKLRSKHPKISDISIAHLWDGINEIADVEYIDKALECAEFEEFKTFKRALEFSKEVDREKHPNSPECMMGAEGFKHCRAHITTRQALEKWFATAEFHSTDSWSPLIWDTNKKLFLVTRYF